MSLAKRGDTVDRLGLVGSHNRTEQSVFLGLDVDQVEHAPASTVYPDVMMYRNQPVTDGPVGQDKTRCPVGKEGMHAVNDSDRPTAGGPVGRLFKLDRLNIGTVNGPASSGDTPPSSDSSVHSLGEQWDNMSTNSMDMESEQNERPSYGVTHDGVSVTPADLRILRKVIDSIASGRIVY